MKATHWRCPMKTNRNKKGPKKSLSASGSGPNRFNSHELVFQPWFLPRASRLAINSLIPPDYRNKMRFYFDDYGCMVCGKHELYESNGMCFACHRLVRSRLKKCLTRRMKGRTGERIDLIMERRKALASRLLGQFSRRRKGVSLRHRLSVASLKNPVDEALVFLTPGSWRDRVQRSKKNRAAERSGVLGKSVRDFRAGRFGR